MAFMMDFLFSINQKNNKQDLILVIIKCLTIIVYYKLIKTTINIVGLTKVIIDILIRYHNLSESMVINQHFWSYLKFQFSLRYFFDIKRKLFKTFSPQRNSQTKRQNSTIKIHVPVFVNKQQKIQAKLLSMIEFVYNIIKNASIDKILFELKYHYYSHISFKNEINLYLKSCLANKLI